MLEKPHSSCHSKYQIAALVLFIAYLALIFYQPIETDDVWWHLKTGEWIVQNKTIPLVDPFSFNEKEIPWIHNQWLGDVLLYGTYRIAGLQGLILFRLIYLICVMALFFLIYRKKISFYFLLVICLLLSYPLSLRCLLRPLLINFPCIIIFFTQLLKHQKDDQSKHILWLPVLGIIWYNIHPGAFVYGNLLWVVFIFHDFVQLFVRDSEKQRIIKRLTQNISIYTLLLLAFCINPHGIKGVLHWFKFFLKPGFSHYGRYSLIIAEARPPLYLLKLSGLWAHLTIALVIFSLAINKKFRFLFLLHFMFALFLFLYTKRASVYFGLISCVIITETFQNSKSFILKIMNKKIFSILRHPAFYIILLISLLAFQGYRKFTKRLYLDGRVVNFYSSAIYFGNPGEAVEFLKETKISGPVFNSHVYGGYLLWSAYPNLKPVKDGRQLDKNFMDQYYDVIISHEELWPQFSKTHNLHIVLLDTAKHFLWKFIDYLNHDPDWQLIFVNKTNVIFVRRNTFDLPEKAQNYETRMTAVKTQESDLELLKQHILSRDRSKIKDMLNPPFHFNDLLEEGALLIDLGYHGAGVQLILRAISINPSSNTKDIAYWAVSEILQGKRSNPGNPKDL